MNDMNDLNGTQGDVASLPIQAAPVYRVTAGGMRTGSGVEPSGWLDYLRTGLDWAGKIGQAW